jgi:Asp/Glu/hydantoin racemase
MARLAVAAGRRVAVAATFAPAIETACALLREAAAEAGHTVEVTTAVAEDAYEALLRGDAARHDKRVLALIREIAALAPDAIVLAQVSMAHLADQARAVSAAPVFSSLETSLEALRGLWEESR